MFDSRLEDDLCSYLQRAGVAGEGALNISKADREELKQASKKLLASLKERLASMPNWTRNAVTQADVQVLILDSLYSSLPRPPFTEQETEALAERLYGFVWQQSESGFLKAAA